MQLLSKTATLRVLILLTFIVAAVKGAAEFYSVLHNLLPGELQRYDEARASAGFSVIDAVGLADTIPLVAGIIGLLWCRRWARILFSVAVVLSPLTTTVTSWLPDTTSVVSGAVADMVSSAVAEGADDALRLLLGVLLAMIWLWMSEEFTNRFENRQADRGLEARAAP